ncbi:hypothetical protein TruAng_006384 [Truncatella angustata]|nr:hypothetical protein TruAng_006384 [Truncatella angustata]
MSTSVASGYSSLFEAVPELVSLNTTSLRTSPYLGGRNFTYGCLQAVSESLQIVEGSLAFKNPSYFDVGITISQVQEAATYGSLCTNNGSAPRVLVPYRWCEANCWGWDASRWNSLQQWIGPLVQFILPCLAFCLSVPRNWRTSFPDWIFNSKDNNIIVYIIFTYIIKLPVAFLIVFWDTIFWLSTCFALAGPMMLSAVYEYTWDGIILDFLEPRKGSPPLVPPVTRARLLLATVVGNIKLEPNVTSRAPTLPGKNTSPPSMIWSQVMELAEELLPTQRKSKVTANDHKSTSVTGQGSHNPGQAVSGSSANTSKTRTDHAEVVHKNGPELKLTALLNAQSSFGGAVGAPVVFFIGSFVYNIVEAETRLGDNDTAHALAFGMWWMTIAHLAVISSAMLASNNPSALQGLIGRARGKSHQTASAAKAERRVEKSSNCSATTSLRARFIRWMKSVKVLEHAFDSTFEPMSLWKRGPNKRLWMDKVVEAYEEDRQDDKFMQTDELLKALRMGFWTRALMLLWSWNVDLSRSHPDSWALQICRGLQIVFGSLAVFSAIGGTLMQIMGVYRNCLCKMPTWVWIYPDSPEATVGMSYVTSESVPVSEVWIYTGAIAAGTLGQVAALAWWHQRRLRRKFLIVADSL